MRMETFVRRQYSMKSHRVESVQEDERGLVAIVKRIPHRSLRCGRCGRVARFRRRLSKDRTWRGLSMGSAAMWIVYAPCQVTCPVCGVGIEMVPWAERWHRVTRSLALSIAVLSRELSWKATAEHFEVSWKAVAKVVRDVVKRGLQRRRLRRLRAIGIDEVSRKKGHRYLTLVYDLERAVIVWIGKDRTSETVEEFFRWLGKRRSRSIEVVCMDMWAPYHKVVQARAPQASIVFDRFHLVGHVNAAVDAVRRAEVNRLRGEDKKALKGFRFILLKNPWNLTPVEQQRLSSFVKLNNAVVKAYLLKEHFQWFWEYVRPAWAIKHLSHWLTLARSSGLAPFKDLANLVEAHWAGIVAWTTRRVSNGTVEGMNNKVKLVSHRAFGFRRVENYMAAIYHCCGKLPLG